ncbi:MAG: cytidine deaminase [Frankiaceae bacterium]
MSEPTSSADATAPPPLDAEDAKLLTLARATRARLGAAEGAAVRDSTGRTYAAGTVALGALRLTAIQAAVAAAVSSGAETLEAAAVVGSADPAAEPVLAELGCPALLVGAADRSDWQRRAVR